MSTHESSNTSPTETKGFKFSSFIKFGMNETTLQEADREQQHFNRVIKGRQYQHKLKPNFYIYRKGSLKAKINSISDKINVKEIEPFEMLSYSYSLPIIPFSPNCITACAESIEYNDNHDLSSGDINEDEDEQYSSMLF